MLKTILAALLCVGCAAPSLAQSTYTTMARVAANGGDGVTGDVSCNGV